jgi:hypothetical protein
MPRRRRFLKGCSPQNALTFPQCLEFDADAPNGRRFPLARR